MIIVGELINSTRKSVAQALEQRDAAFIQDLAIRQAEAGANYIDVNTASGGDEIDNMNWVVNLIQKVTDVPLCIDSPSPAALEAGLALCKHRPMVNSISAEKERWDSVLPLVKKYQAKVVALCMDDCGMPDTVSARLDVTKKMVEGLNSAGIPDDDIYLDPLVKPIGVNHDFGIEILDSTKALRETYPNCHIISGLSNVSYGLPERRLLNRAYMVMSIARGMDAFILDPIDKTLMSLFMAAKALAGKDQFCMDYISEVRAGRIKA